MPKQNEKQKIITALCIKHTGDLLMCESSDEEDEDEIMESFQMELMCLLSNRRSVHLGLPKSTVWEQKVLRNLDESRFSQMLRVKSTEFAHILDLIKDDAVFANSNNSPQLPIELQLKIVLFRLGSSGDGVCVRKVASIFGVGDGGTIEKVTKRVLTAVVNLKKKFLYWPNASERQKLISATSHELPGCVGYIDGSEMRLAEAPVGKHSLYFSRKRQYAIKMQVICDYKLRIRQLVTGYPGSVHDAKIFNNCPLAKHPGQYLSASQWIAGDSAYPLKPYLITPFRENNTEHPREVREQFNRYFSKYRVHIENCFGVLKERFGSLKELKFRMQNKKNMKACNDWIVACCILHNVIISFNENNENPDEISPPQFVLPPSNNLRDSLLTFVQSQSSVN